MALAFPSWLPNQLFGPTDPFAFPVIVTPPLPTPGPLGPPPPATVPTAFDVASHGSSSLTSGAVAGTDVTWSHAGASSLTGAAVLVAICAIGTITGTPTYGSFTSAATYGGVSMTKLGGAFFLMGGSEWSLTDLYGLQSPPGGTQTVDASVSQAIHTRIAGLGIAATYAGVGGFGSPHTNTGSSVSTIGITAASDAANKAFCVIGGGSGYTGFTSYTQTQRDVVINGSGGMIIGDAPGAASVVFQAHATNYEWEAVAVDLLPM